MLLKLLKKTFLFQNPLREQFSPLYFLATLGNGGLAITFFMYLMFLTPHSNTPIPTSDTIYNVITGDHFGAAAGVLLVLLGILLFAVRHFWTLVWNLREYHFFRQTNAYRDLHQANAEVSLMAIPLTLAMSINVLFVLGALFIPKLWSVVEYLFPFSLLAFALIGFYAIKLFSTFFVRILSTGHFDCARNNNLNQMLAVFTFAMVGVGFAAAAAMSHLLVTVVIGSLGAIFFTSAALLWGLVTFVLGFRTMLERGIDQESSVSLWIVIPILTLLGITWIRLSHGLHHHFETPVSSGFLFVLISAFFSLQLLLGGLGYQVMRQVNYYPEFIRGPRRSVASYALICPGVALFVFGMFFIHIGLLANGVINRFSIAHWVLITPLVFVQIKTILMIWHLDHKFFGGDHIQPLDNNATHPV